MAPLKAMRSIMQDGTKKYDDRDYFFRCNTCQGEFEKKYTKLLTKT